MTKSKFDNYLKKRREDDSDGMVSETEGGTVTGDLKIHGTGTFQLTGDATVFDDIRVPLSSIKRLGNSDPGWTKFKDDGAGSNGGCQTGGPTHRSPIDNAPAVAAGILEATFGTWPAVCG